MGRADMDFRIGCGQGAQKTVSGKRHAEALSPTEAMLACCGSSFTSEVKCTRLRPLSSTERPDSSRSASHSDPDDTAGSLDTSLRECRVTHNRRSHRRAKSTMTYVNMHVKMQLNVFNYKDASVGQWVYRESDVRCGVDKPFSPALTDTFS